MKKFPKLKYPGDSETDGILAGEVVVTEKIDGANFRFTWDDGKLRIGTRNHTYDADGENVPVAFDHAIEYLERVTEGYDPPEDVTFYGEALHLHSLDYDDIDWEMPSKGSAHVPQDSKHPNVVLFDARKDGEWMHFEDVCLLVEDSPFEMTKIVESGEPDDLGLEIPDTSMFGGQPEGIVARRIDGSIRAKKVSDDFKKNTFVLFNAFSKLCTDAGQFVAQFVTDVRIEKMVHKLIDRGEYDEISMPMMEDLPREVLKDVMAEEGWNLLTSGSMEVEWDDDFKGEVRSKTSKKCARVLKSEVNEF